MNKWSIGIIVFVLILSGIVYAVYESTDYDFDDAKKSYKVINTWELPKKLDEISGLHFIDEERIACVQDEDGIIFIYSLKTEEILREHKFAAPGDYEAMAYLNNEYWIAESNGEIFQVSDLDTQDGELEGIQLDFEYRNNIEGMAASSDGKLWLAVKERNLDNSGDYKGIYEFDPETKILNREPIAKIQYNDPKFDILKTDNPRKLIRPSDIGFNPVNGNLYILDAEFPKLIITDKSGKIIELHLLDPAEFEQPEGITFSNSGRIFISNESVGGPANIKEISFE